VILKSVLATQSSAEADSHLSEAPSRDPEDRQADLEAQLGSSRNPASISGEGMSKMPNELILRVIAIGAASVWTPLLTARIPR
jgi:hypothetical protein